ncbi:MAG: response regulator [Candidatus Brocadiia bacterium]
MDRISILVIDDERAVLDTLMRDLDRFSTHFRIEPCESAADAADVIRELKADGWALGLVLADHLMPNMSGVDFLVQLNSDPYSSAARKVLITAQAGLEDTIQAINRGGLNHYIRKPWRKDQLEEVLCDQLTGYVLENVEDPLPFAQVLDASRIFSAIHRRGASGRL